IFSIFPPIASNWWEDGENYYLFKMSLLDNSHNNLSMKQNYLNKKYEILRKAVKKICLKYLD
ncbi:MAG: hypothetical protein ACP8RL_07345, partial [cyanobacterium endosymbiont of Rhopalodia inflata]